MSTTPTTSSPAQHMITLTYSGAAPAPIDRDWSAVAEEQAKKRTLASKAAAPSQVAAASSSGGLFSVFEKARQTVAGAIDGVGSATQAVNSSRDLDDFPVSFPRASQVSGRLVAAYSCSAMHNGSGVGASLYVTTSHLCVSLSGGTVKDVFAFADIVSWLPALALPTENGVPFFVLVPNSHVAPDAVELFTEQGHVVQLYNIKPRGVQLPVGSPVPTLRLLADIDRHWPPHRPDGSNLNPGKHVAIA